MSDDARPETHLEDENDANAQLIELQDSFVNALTHSGALGKLRAQLRAAALSLLRGDSEMHEATVGKGLNPFDLSPSCKLTLLLIQNFLLEKGLTETASILEAEASLKFISGDDASVAEELISKSNENTLEQLISDGLQAREGGITVAKKKTDEGAESPTGGLSETPLEEPSNMETYRALSEYEPSIDFSDEEGAIPEGACIEIV
ncbi:hypothetical protein AGDE_07497 [Angomonas deanei]|uniref:Uncharacterized protein n=1 Tax=Angomonas deanei TaxID=59799 RepID=A0A7G2CFR9_9TRYP|nr:hypothetical protein AGDE_07497 [Angomonas deanei]CAD2217867.1 hypothetical protein, conserved [Angomonas deanei]|eukprot:EPY35281.1 hypothetical protein AGDE_07497 [Angomonas deanei]